MDEERRTTETNQIVLQGLPHYLTAADVARMLGVQTRTVYSWVDRGLLPARRVGPRLLRFTAQDLECFYRTSGSLT